MCVGGCVGGKSDGTLLSLEQQKYRIGDHMYHEQYLICEVSFRRNIKVSTSVFTYIGSLSEFNG